MSTRSFSALLVAILALAGCEPQQSSSPETTAEPPLPAGVPDPEAQSFAEPIERAHGAAAWREKEALAADVTVTFGGETALDARMLMSTDMSRTQLELESGAVAVWDGSDAYVAPPDAELPRARFHVLTWSYFLSAPMKLRDPGTYLEPLGEMPLQGEVYDAAKLTFGPGVGDTPDDWYVLYRDQETGRLHAMAYVVTYGTTLDEAEAEPHAITYGGFQEVGGVQVATEWTFWLWSEEQGIHGDPIGSVTLEDVEFVEPPEGAFDVPENARKEELPQS